MSALYAKLFANEQSSIDLGLARVGKVISAEMRTVVWTGKQSSLSDFFFFYCTDSKGLTSLKWTYYSFSSFLTYLLCYCDELSS